jgi:hypothetical protein
MSKEYYKPGDHWVIDDRTGRKIRASESKREWNGLIVHKDGWEPRHPQDLVRGRLDRMAVPDARPRPVDAYIGPLTTDITAAAAAGAQVVSVTSSERMFAGDNVSIMLDNGDTFRATISGVADSETLHISPALPGAVSDGNRLFNNSAVAPPDIG